MMVEFNDGKIISECKSFQPVSYDVTNQSLIVRFDGKGCISKYAVLGEKVYYEADRASWKIYINGKELPFNTNKKVEMIGRTQQVTWTHPSGTITMKLFLEENTDSVLQTVRADFKEPVSLQMALCMYGVISGSGVKTQDEESLVYSDNVIKTDFAYMMQNPTNDFSFVSDTCFEVIEGNGMAFFDFGSEVLTKEFNLAYGFGVKAPDKNVVEIKKLEENALNEIKNIVIPSSVKSEQDKALYYSAYFCALENYKDKGEFKGFMAGIGYLNPYRTYYRDSYFTVLSMFNGQTDKIRNQIITLGKGVSNTGECPSAVINDFSPWWGNHFDSPSMFAILIFDYVNNTKDFSVLSKMVGDTTVLAKAEAVVAKLAEDCDETGLIVKKGKNNTRDWADIVNRYGYVTYVEVLYARALYCLSVLFKYSDAQKSAMYLEKYNKVKNSINEILWDDTLGYYVNFKNEDYTEKNLSVDTVLAAIYGIADQDRALTMLASCQKMLESRNNPEVEDFGILCVYPPYEKLYASFGRSAKPFEYHNGSCWPYWAGMYAYALKMYGMDYEYALTRWFTYNIEKNNFTPIEYYSPYCADGALLQAWSSTAAFVYYDVNCDFFNDKI